MSDHIPHEVLTEILLRLPAKSLLRFSCVCKSWYSLITNPNFISMYTHHNLDNNNNKSTTQLLSTRYSWIWRKDFYSFHHEGDDGSFSKYQELASPMEDSCLFVNSCHGLLCLIDYSEKDHITILWNPSIRKLVTLPNSDLCGGQYVIGFGFDSKKNDYKVVRIVYFCEIYPCSIIDPPKVEVYELSEGAWRSISALAIPPYVISDFSPPVFMNGAVHWIGYNHNKYNHNNSESPDNFCRLVVVSFDMADEVFREFKMPEGVGHSLSMLDLYSVTECGQLLGLIDHRGWLDSGYIWVMKEYGVAESWTLQSNNKALGKIGRTIGLGKNDRVLMASTDGEVVLYDLKSQRSSNTGIHGEIDNFHLITCMESLVLLKGPNGIFGGASSYNAIAQGGETVFSGEDGVVSSKMAL